VGGDAGGQGAAPASAAGVGVPPSAEPGSAGGAAGDVLAHVSGEATLSHVQPAAQSAVVAQVTGSVWQLDVVEDGQAHVVGGTGAAIPPSALLGAEPAHAQSDWSARQLKPAPQSASTLQGTS
jgi:hypothetical protein